MFPIRVGANALIVRSGSLLVVEFTDDTGRHYNLPGGGVEAHESVKEGLKREVYEETCAEVNVGKLAFVVEYEPCRNGGWAGSVHKLSPIFVCSPLPNSEPRLPARPDPNQSGVHCVPLKTLPSTKLLPHLSERLTAYLANPQGAVFLEEPLEERNRRELP
jgi:ADP-ribose pyrophosphatase YjhB (NUDIX family)